MILLFSLQFVDKAVKTLENDYRDKKGDTTFDVVRLDGVYCFSLKDAIKEMCSQLFHSDDEADNEMLNEVDYKETAAFDGKFAISSICIINIAKLLK